MSDLIGNHIVGFSTRLICLTITLHLHLQTCLESSIAADLLLQLFSISVTNIKNITGNIRAAMRENRSSGFPTRYDTNQSVQSQKRARSLKFHIYEEEELYYLSSENKGADQLHSFCEADLRLCFCIGKNLVYS